MRRDGPQRVRRALEGAVGGLSVDELAASAGLHANAVRRILARLVATEEVRAERQPPRTRGRPLLKYRLVGGADEPFKRFVPLLLELLDAPTRSAEAAYEAGYARGAPAPGSAPTSTREAMVESLTMLGFAPRERRSVTPGRVTLDLTRCPFTDPVTTSANGRAICHLHHGMLAGVAHASGGTLEEFVINDPRVTPCQVAFAPATR